MLNVAVGKSQVRQRMNFSEVGRQQLIKKGPNRILTDDKLDIIVTANSPGEVATWLVPTLKALKERLPSAEFTVFIPPCTFASGQEQAVVAALPGVKRTFNKRQLLSFILTGKGLSDYSLALGVLCFLGSDLAYALLLARRLGYPAFAYMLNTEGQFNG